MRPRARRQTGSAGAHLVSSEPYGEAWVVDALRAAARLALGRGAPEAAVRYLRRALKEPPLHEARLDVVLELGRAEVFLPVAQDFPALREALKAATSDPGQRVQIAIHLVLANISVGDNAAAREVLARVLGPVESLDPAQRGQLEAHLIGGGAPDLAAAPMVLAGISRCTFLLRATRGELHDPAMLTAMAQTGEYGSPLRRMPPSWPGGLCAMSGCWNSA